MIFTALVVTLHACQSDENIRPSSNSLDLAIAEIELFVKQNPNLESSVVEEQILSILARYKQIRTTSDVRLVSILNEVRGTSLLNAKEAEAAPCTGKIINYELVDLSPTGDWSGEIMQVYFYADGSTYYVISKDRKLIEKGCFKRGKDYPVTYY